MAVDPKIPAFWSAVGTVDVLVDSFRLCTPSNAPKNQALSLITGPPSDPPY